MQDYVIFTDASADIDPVFLREHDIRFVSMEYSVGEEQRLCERPETDETLKAFYDAQRTGIHTQTSQITPQHYKDTFKPFLKEGVSVLYLSLSGGLTKTYDSVKLAKAETENTRAPSIRWTRCPPRAASGCWRSARCATARRA